MTSQALTQSSTSYLFGGTDGFLDGRHVSWMC